MTGPTMKELVRSSGISFAELARALGISVASVLDTFEAARLRPSTLDRYLLAISRLNRTRAKERERVRIEAALVGADTSSIAD